MNVGIKVLSRENGEQYLKSMDFEIYIDGVSDNTLYRMTKGDKTFRKLFSCRTKYGYTVRGKVRAKIEKLVDAIFDTNQNFAVSIEI